MGATRTPTPASPLKRFADPPHKGRVALGTNPAINNCLNKRHAKDAQVVCNATLVVPIGRETNHDQHDALVHRPDHGSGQIGMAAAVSIGIGGMVGAGIFSILGVVAQAAGNAMWLAFAIGGVVALLSTYSYAKLGATFPSAGGAVHFLVKSFGDGVLAGGLNLFMWAGYIISLALYATAFGSYAATFVTTTPSPLLVKSLARRRRAAADDRQRVRRADRWAARKPSSSRSRSRSWCCSPAPVCGSSSPAICRRRCGRRPQSILFGAGVLFIGYEGFGLVTNAAARHARSADHAAARALHQRDPGDHHLSRGLDHRDRQPDRRADRAGAGLRAGRGGEAVPRRIRISADRDRGAVLDRVGDQRHALRLGQRLLHDRPRRRIAGAARPARSGRTRPAGFC